jgi:hypothetical protein
MDGGKGIGKGPANEIIEVRKDYYNESMTVTRAQAIAEREAFTNPNLMKASAYDDLPGAAGPNRQVIDGLVHVGPKGAPEVVPKLSNEAAMARFKEMGVPVGDTAWNNLKASGDAAALVEILPPGSKYLGAGVEGAGFSLPGSTRAIRIQHGGGQPLLQADIGKAGVYSDWMAQYGKTWVEQKERVAMQAAYMHGGKVNAAGRGGNIARWKQFPAEMQGKMEANMKQTWGKNVKSLDNHEWNVGIDYQGRMRAFDAGAYVRTNDQVVAAIWNPEQVVKVVNPGKSRWQRVLRKAGN